MGRQRCRHSKTQDRALRPLNDGCPAEFHKANHGKTAGTARAWPRSRHMDADREKRRAEKQARRTVASRMLGYFHSLQMALEDDSERFFEQVMEQHRAQQQHKPEHAV